MYFKYGTKEIEYLKKQDSKMKEVIEKIGHINRAVTPDLYVALVNNIISQQISTKAAATVWDRFVLKYNPLTAENVIQSSIEEIQTLGTSYRKAEYIYLLTSSIINKELDLNNLVNLTDQEVIKELTKIKGIGKWTAEMMLIFSLQRPNVLSYGDFAILKGLRMVYNKEEITKEIFKEYQELFDPYNSVASLYLWAVAGGAIPELIDPYKKNK